MRCACARAGVRAGGLCRTHHEEVDGEEELLELLEGGVVGGVVPRGGRGGRGLGLWVPCCCGREARAPLQIAQQCAHRAQRRKRPHKHHGSGRSVQRHGDALNDGRDSIAAIIIMAATRLEPWPRRASHLNRRRRTRAVTGARAGARARTWRRQRAGGGEEGTEQRVKQRAAEDEGRASVCGGGSRCCGAIALPPPCRQRGFCRASTAHSQALAKTRA